jgi:hypothetical protein
VGIERERRCVEAFKAPCAPVIRVSGHEFEVALRDEAPQVVSTYTDPV